MASAIPQAVSGILDWSDAVSLQAGRILRGSVWREQEFDAFFFTMALSCLLLEAERAAKELTGVQDEVSAALAEFHAQVPDARTIRNAVAHMDAWARGEGHGQQRPLWLTVERGPDRYALWVSEKRLDVETAVTAAVTLRWRIFLAWSDHDAQETPPP